MRFKIYLILLLAIAALASPPLSADTQTFFGVDTVITDTTITYANGSESYDFTGIRFKYGLEDDAGGSAGIELITGDSDEIIDPFGSPFKLETGPTLGAYATIGKPIYLRFGWSVWETEYTDINLSLVNKETVNSFDIGVGFNLLVGSNITLYADYSIRDTDAEYPTHVAGTGQVDYESELVSAGFNFLF